MKIYLFNSLTLRHTQQLCVDDDTAVIGSSNLHVHSFSLKLEVAPLSCDKSDLARWRRTSQVGRRRAK